MIKIAKTKSHEKELDHKRRMERKGSPHLCE